MGDSSAPDPGLVYSLYTGGYKTQLVRIALLLDVFSPLAAGPAGAESVARACGCDVAGTRALLDYLASLRVLDRQEDAYALTPTAATFLVRGSRAYVCFVTWTSAPSIPRSRTRPPPPSAARR